MALPVYQIMAQLQEGVNAKGAEAEEKEDEAVDEEAEAVEKGDKAVEDEAVAVEEGDKAVDDEAEMMNAEAEDRVLSDIKLEIVDGEKDGSRWLIVDDLHICYQNNVKGKKERTGDGRSTASGGNARRGDTWVVLFRSSRLFRKTGLPSKLYR